MRLFSCVIAILIVVQNEWLATDSQNAILNNFVEYYILKEVAMVNGTVLQEMMFLLQIVLRI